jgi:acetyl-CoA acetyltransferase
MGERAAIVGIGQTPYAKGLDASEAGLAVTAIRAALDDAGLTPADVDGICRYDLESTTDAALARTLGLRDVGFFASHNHGGGAYCALLTSAAAAIAAGHATTVVCFRARRRGARSSFGPGAAQGGRPWQKVGRRLSGGYQYSVPFGLQSPVQEMALIARRHMHDHGTTEDHFGEVAVAIRGHAARNPAAVMRAPMTLADHHASRPVAEPLRLLDCCIETDGACAVIVTAAERARDLRQRPAHLLAAAQCAGAAHHRPTDWFRYDRNGWVAAGARRLWDTAGVGPADVDVALVYDHFTPMVLIALEDWGFCPRGEGGRFVEGGRIRWPDGELPVNTHGGQLSEAFIHGLNNVVEGVRQVRGTSPCQVEDAEIVFIAAASSDPHGAVLLTSAAPARPPSNGGESVHG